MTIERQPLVQMLVPCSYEGRAETEDGSTVFRFSCGELVLRDRAYAYKFERRLREARSKHCGKFGLSLQFRLRNNTKAREAGNG